MTYPPTSDVDEWRYLLEERIGILEDSGEPDAEAVARAMMVEAWRAAQAREREDR